jgi:hypothetical protein
MRRQNQEMTKVEPAEDFKTLIADSAGASLKRLGIGIARGMVLDLNCHAGLGSRRRDWIDGFKRNNTAFRPALPAK